MLIMFVEYVLGTRHDHRFWTPIRYGEGWCYNLPWIYSLSHELSPSPMNLLLHLKLFVASSCVAFGNKLPSVLSTQAAITMAVRHMQVRIPTNGVLAPTPSPIMTPPAPSQRSSTPSWNLKSHSIKMRGLAPPENIWCPLLLVAPP